MQNQQQQNNNLQIRNDPAQNQHLQQLQQSQQQQQQQLQQSLQNQQNLQNLQNQGQQQNMQNGQQTSSAGQTGSGASSQINPNLQQAINQVQNHGGSQYGQAGSAQHQALAQLLGVWEVGLM